MIRGKNLLLIPWVLAAFDLPAQSPRSTPSIPDVFLRVAARQRSEGEFSPWVHVMELDCRKGDCDFTTLTLNQCFGEEKSAVFHPRIQRTSTRRGTLKVVSIGQDRLKLTESEEGIQMNYVIGYRRGPTLDGHTVTYFTGGWQKMSSILIRQKKSWVDSGSGSLPSE